VNAVVRPPWPETTPRLRLGALRIDLRFRRVLHAEAEVELPQRVFDLLLVLLREPHALHTRAALLARVWSGVIVEDANLSQAIWTLRNAFGAERRDWIRTVSKRGYVFAPPCAIELDDDAAALPAPSEPPPARIAVPASGRFAAWRRAGAAATIALVLALAASTAFRADEPAAPPRIAVMEIADAGAADASRWPATLLRSWLEWKLSMLPEVTLLQRDHFAADRGDAAAPALVLVSSGAGAAPGRWFVQVQVEIDGERLRERIEADAAALPQEIDRLASQLLTQLLPARAPQDWPPLQLDAEAAEAFAGFVRTREARDWTRAAQQGRELLTRAPRFGLLRLQLAQTLVMLGQVREAQANAAAAREQLQPLPADAAELLDAHRVALTQDPAATFARYDALARRYPLQARFVLERARALLQLGRPADALQSMLGFDWGSQPVATRIGAELARAHAALLLGDPIAARREAESVREHSAAAGWAMEQGHALFALAAAHMIEQRGLTDASLFEAAALQFERAGDAMRALESRLHSASGGLDAAAARELDELLAQARAAGHRGLEIHALRAVAFRLHRAGDLAGYRAHLAQAAGVAHDAGDRAALRLLDLDLLSLDIDAGDFAAAEARLARLRDAGLQGETGFWISHFAQALAWRRGRYDEVLAELEASAAHAAPGTTAPTVFALHHCMRAQLHVVRGEPGPARTAFERCGDSPAPVYRALAQAGLARLELYSGADVASRGRIAQLPALLDAIPSELDRTGLRLDLGDLLLRSGDDAGAEPVFEAARAAMHDAGLHALEAEARLGLARIAQRRGALRNVERQLDRVRTLAPDDDWPLQVARIPLEAWLHVRRGDRERAAELLTSLDRAARERGDVLAETEVHAALTSYGLDAGCDMRERERLLAYSGLRGLRDGVSGVVMLAEAARRD
jgi:DNA-binding winged helix-turn-helix (wHTH) protein